MVIHTFCWILAAEMKEMIFPPSETEIMALVGEIEVRWQIMSKGLSHQNRKWIEWFHITAAENEVSARLPEVKKKTEKWTSSEIHPTSTSVGRKSHTWVWNAGEKHRHHTLSQKRGKRGLAEVIGRCCFRIQMFFVNINFGIVTNLVWLLLLPDSGDMQVVIRFLARRLIAGRQRQRMSMTPCTHRCKLITESWSW